MKRYKFAVLTLLGIAVISALVLFSGSTRAQSSAPVWGLVANVVPSDANLTSVFMLDQNNAWVAGSEGTQGVIYRLQWQGGSWVALSDEYYNPTFAVPVNSVVAISDDNVRAAVGAVSITGTVDGGIAHGSRSGPSWSWSAELPLIGKSLTTIQMLGDGEEGWAGGYAPVPGTTGDTVPVLLHYKNNLWQADPSISSTSGPGTIHSLHFIQGAGWAVGNEQAWQYNGSHWVEEPLPRIPCLGGYMLNGVRTIGRDEAWAVGSLRCQAMLRDTQIMLHRMGGSWHIVELSQENLPGDRLNAVSFTSDRFGLAVGGQSKQLYGPELYYIISYRTDGQWHYENTPDMQGTLQSVSQADATHALAVGTNGVILSYGYGPGSPVPTATPTSTPVANPTPFPLPSERIGDPHNPQVTYFPLVGHTLSGGFRDYWNAHGGLAQFGYPITEEFREKSPTDGKEYTVQYFERARFEWHPENHPPYDVLLGLLGRTITQGRENEQPFRPLPPNPGKGGPLYFAETGHFMDPEFTQYWQEHGGLPVYGYPISEAFMEVSKADGKPYLVQYFERNRLEYHPELPEAYRVSLGLLGTEVLRTRGWIQ